MQRAPKKPPEPPERTGTVRQEMVAALSEGRPMTARDISAAVRIPERHVPEHLEHIRRSLSGTARELKVLPAECSSCGYVFKGRERLTRPGHCPKCKGTHLMEPAFEVVGRD